MSEKPEKNKNDKDWWLSKGLPIFLETSGWIAFPVLAALFVGRWLDQRFNTAPWYFLSLTIGAFIISSIGIGMVGIKYMKKIDQEEKEKKSKEQKVDEPR